MYGQILVEIVIPKGEVVFEKKDRSLFRQSEMGGFRSTSSFKDTS